MLIAGSDCHSKKIEFVICKLYRSSKQLSVCMILYAYQIQMINF